ncbi:MAG: hypothetical protein QM756_16325 [Polyangiaceae bacterium]
MWLQKSAVSYREAMVATATRTGMAWLVFYAFVDALALTVLVFIRTRFGGRFLTPIHLYFGWAMLTFVFQNDTTGLGKMYTAAFLIVGIGRQLGVYYRFFRRSTPPVMSRSAGDPYGFFYAVFRNHWLIVIVVEPLLVYLLGQELASRCRSVSMAYFEIAAGLLFFQGMHLWRLTREERLDRQDLDIIAKQAAEASQEERAPQTKPHVVETSGSTVRDLAGLRAWSERQRKHNGERRLP